MSDDQVTISRKLLRQVLDYVEKGNPGHIAYRINVLVELRTALEQPIGGLDDPTRIGWAFWRIKDLEQQLASRLVYTAPQAQQPRIGTVTSVEQALEQWEHDFNNPMTPEQQADWVKREREFAARQAQQPASVQEPDVDYRSMYLKVRDDLAAAQQRLDTCEALARSVMNDQVGRA